MKGAKCSVRGFGFRLLLQVGDFLLSLNLLQSLAYKVRNSETLRAAMYSWPSFRQTPPLLSLCAPASLSLVPSNDSQRFQVRNLLCWNMVNMTTAAIRAIQIEPNPESPIDTNPNLLCETSCITYLANMCIRSSLRILTQALLLNRDGSVSDAINDGGRT